jgi:hypothetical protein
LIYHKNIKADVLIEDLLRARREEILKISAKHGAFNVRVFGSAARGEAGEQSDIDLLVDVGANRTPFFPGGLLADLEDLLGRRVDIVTEEGLHWYIREKVIKEAVPLWRTTDSITFLYILSFSLAIRSENDHDNNYDSIDADFLI